MTLIKKNREKAALFLILLLTAFLAGYKIWEIGDANTYYTAAVKSMLTSWHNFFYASFDPVGFITVDKPALGLWLQSLFALVFGVHGWSVALPEILCSILSVAVLYSIVKRRFDVQAGLLAALFLALTPIFIAATRTNNLDASLVLVCLLAVRAAVAAAEKGSLKLLILSMTLIGVGFNIKMLQAFLYLPVIYLVYFFTSTATLKKRFAHLAVATVVLLAVSASWCLAVDLTAAGARPYVGSSDTNSAFELAFGYNGLARIFGARADLSDGLSGIVSSAGGGPGGASEDGTPGLLRLFNTELAGQIGWMLILALFGIVMLVINVVNAGKDEKKAAWRQLLLWAGLFVTMYAYFSVSKFYHRYYLIMLAPCLAALGAIAVRDGMRMFRRGEDTGKNKWRKWLLPAGIFLTAAVQIYFLIHHYTAYSKALVWIIAICTALSIAGFILIKAFGKDNKRLAATAAAIGILGLLAAPAYWAYSPIQYGSNASLPYAGPSDVSAGSMPGVQGGTFRPDDDGNLPGNDNLPDNGNFPDGGGNLPDGGMDSGVKPPAAGKLPAGQDAGGAFPAMNQDAPGANPDAGGRRSLPDAMIRYMLDNSNGSSFLVAVLNAGTAAPIISDYGVGVMAVGGFSGGDNAISLEAFIRLVKDGEIAFFWSGDSGNGGSSFYRQIASWVARNGIEVTPADWLGNGQTSVVNVQAGTLYDLTSLAEN